MDRPLYIGHVYNISLENNNNEYPGIVTHFSCDRKSIPNGNEICGAECIAIKLQSVYNVTLKGISLTIQAPNICGITLQYVSNSHIQVDVSCLLRASYSEIDIRIGILMYEASMVEIHSSHVSSCSGGLVLQNTSNIHIINVTTMTSIDTPSMSFPTQGTGLSLLSTTNASITDTSTAHNAVGGMFLRDTANVTVTNATVMHNLVGINLENTTEVYITNATVMYNHHMGMELDSSARISILYATLLYNGQGGLGMWNSTSICAINTNVTLNGHNGIYLENTIRVSVIRTTITYNGYNGMYLWNTTKISIINTTAMLNDNVGIGLWNTTSISMISTSAMYNGHHGMDLENTTNISILSTTVQYNGNGGIVLWKSTIISIISTTVMNNHYHGISVNSATRISLLNSTVMYNGHNGVGLWNTATVNIINTSVLYNGHNGMYLANSTRISIINTSTMHNDYNGMVLELTASASIINTTAVHNGYVGMALLHTSKFNILNTTLMHNGYGGIHIFYTININVTKSSLIHNGWRKEVATLSGDYYSAADSTSLPAVIVLYNSSIRVSGCIVTRNNISAVKAYASIITVSDDVVISNNRAIAGTAFIFVQNSVLKLEKNGCLHFKNNYAINIGGVFYVTDNVHYSYITYDETLYPLVESTCFLTTQGSRSQTQLSFSNNTAGEGGDILYGGHLLYGLDGDWNCLESFRNISNISQNSLSLITSDPSRVCLCNDDGQPDCLIVTDPTPHSLYPGQSVKISAVVVGQDFGTVAGTVYAQFLQKMITYGSPQSESWQRIQGVTQEKCNHLEYTIFSPHNVSEVVLILTADNRRVPFLVNKESTVTNEGWWKDLEDIYHTSALQPMKYGHDPVYVTISLTPCPAGFMLTVDPPFRCDCNQLLQDLRGVKCYIQDQTISRSGLVWIGTLKGYNGTVVTSEYCLLDYCSKEYINVTLSDPDSQCNYNHSGTLCGGCQPGLSLALGSAQCLPCSNRYLALLIPFALAGPALVFFIKLLGLTISQGTINGLVFYANIVKANDYIFLPQGQINPLTLFIAWINLDLGVETCFFNGLTAYTKTWLQFVFPLYIWSIAGLIIILAKYSDWVAKVMGNNSVPVLATLLLLSYAKLFRTIITALSYTLLYSSQGQKAVWSADGNVDYLGSKHAPLFAVAVVALLFLYLPYTLLLFLGQWLHRCHCQLIDQILMKIKPFLDAHYGPLKGKHHYWFGALLLVRVTILLISALIPINHANIINFCVSISALMLMYFGPIVHRNTIVAMFENFFFMNLVGLCLTKFFTTLSGGDQDVAAYTVIGMAFVQFLGLVLFKLFSILKRTEKVKACFHRGQPAEDDWDLYEEAALQREMDFDTEEEESNACESIESRPTYYIMYNDT